MLRAVGSLVAVVVISASSPARADKETAARARKLAEEGAQTGDRGKLEESIALYRKLYAEDPHPIYRCNIATSYRVLEDLPRAHVHLTACLARLPAVQPAAVPVFRDQLDELEQLLVAKHVAVDIVTDPAGANVTVSTVSGDTLVSPAIVWLPEGRHEVQVERDGYRPGADAIEISADDVAAHPRKTARIVLEKAVVESPPREREPVAAPARKDRTGAWIALGIGGAALAGGGVMHAITYGTRQELADLSGDAYETKLPDFERQRLITYSLYGVGAAAVITGAVLYYLSPEHGDRVAVVPAPGGDGATVWIDLSP